MGSALVGATISATGHEKEFYKAVKNYVVGLSSLITCDNDPDDEFDYATKGDSHIATLDFKINGVHAFKLYRPAVLRSNGSEAGVSAINFAMDISESIPSNDGGLRFKFSDYGIGDPVAQSTSIKRGLIISHIVNDNFVLLCFSPALYSYQSQGNNNTKRMVHCLSDSSTTFVTSSTGGVSLSSAGMFNISSLTMYDKAVTIPSGTFISRFSYTSPPGKIDYIKSSIYQNNNSKMFENKAIYDSTTVTVGDTVSLKDGSYVAIGTHQLVKCS